MKKNVENKTYNEFTNIISEIENYANDSNLSELQIVEKLKKLYSNGIKKIKNQIMKNIFIYYLTILTPLAIIIWLNKTNSIDSTYFVGLLFIYLLIFRTYIDGKRLFDKNVIQKKDIWKMIIPGKHIEYFKELYLK